jgi:Flp pilus assembly secretin CpaC
MLKVCCLIALTALLFGVAGASAVELPSFEPVPAQTYHLTMGVSQVLTLSQPVGRVFIDDPAVLDVNPLTDRRLLLLPRSSGSTSVIILDKQDQQLASFIVTTSESRVELWRDDHSVTHYQCSATDCEPEPPMAKAAPEAAK